MNKKTKQNNNNPSIDFANKLKFQGHNCICILKTKPIKVRWYGQIQCIKKKSNNK